MSLVSYDNSSDESEDDIKPMKKSKESVKITIPSLKEFEDDDEPVVKKAKFQSGSGLCSLLPPPKNTLSVGKSGFMPHILISKKEKLLSSSTKCLKNVTTASTPIKSTTSSTTALPTSDEQESDDEYVPTNDSSKTSGSCDFFWLDDLASKNKTKIDDTILTPIKGDTFLQDLSSQLPCSSKSTLHPPYLKEIKEDSFLKHHQISTMDAPVVEENTDNISSQQQWPTVEDNYMSNLSDDSKETLLNDKEFLKLQGRKREFDNVDIIDVNADDQLTNRNEWLMKSVTEEMTYKPKKKHGLPTQQQKRKHQITYLAFQAKEREMDLKNQWALNRLTRRETQSKYGF